MGTNRGADLSEYRDRAFIVTEQKIESMGTVESKWVEVVMQVHKSPLPQVSIFLVKLLFDYILHSL